MSRMTTRNLKTYMHRYSYGPPPAHWRWELASRTASSRMSLKKIEKIAGTWIRKSVEHLRSGPSKYPEIEAARWVQETESTLRDELEARFLAGQCDEEVATKMELPQGVIEAYEGIFFDVRSRLSFSGWIRCHAMRWTPYEEPYKLGTVLRQFAYYGGPYLLEAYLPIARRYAAALSNGTISDVRKSDTQVNRLARIIDLHSMVVTEDNVMNLFRIHAALIARDRWLVEKPLEDATDVEQRLEEAIAALPQATPPDTEKWAAAAA
jgi:hypothetical protein